MLFCSSSLYPFLLVTSLSMHQSLILLEHLQNTKITRTVDIQVSRTEEAVYGWNYLGTQRFSHSRMLIKVKMWSRMRENLWNRTLQHTNPIRSRLWSFWVKIWPGNLNLAACGWTGSSKGPNVCARGSLAFQIFALCLFIGKKTSGFQSRLKSDFHVRFLRGKQIS